MSKNKDKIKALTRDNYFTAYIMRGNKQAMRVHVRASKRFTVNNNTYIIKKESIFTKIIRNKIESVAYYSEGNPNPHNFKGKNDGLTYDEFNVIYGEDLYNILVSLLKNNKLFYLVILEIAVFICAIITLISVFFLHV
jgi:hypothetical protein